MWNHLNYLQIDEEFLLSLQQDYEFVKQKRLTGEAFTSYELINLAQKLENFIIDKFNFDISKEKKKFNKFDLKAEIKKNFIQKKVFAHFKNFEGEIPDLLSEEEFTTIVLSGEREEEMKHYARFALFHEKGILHHKNGSLFKFPKKNIINFKTDNSNPLIYTGDGEFFKTEEQNFNMTKYCIYCHKQKRDYCRTHNPISGEIGCPLDQKISEMNLLKSKGFIFAPLAIMMIDNPLCILTGHRICNDCKKACIFQKQTPVDVPSIESQIIDDVLSLPFGFEVYFLLSNWNPLLVKDFLPKKFNGKSVLVCGAGPAGILSSYYFLREGFSVLLIDGLKLKKLNIDSAIKDAKNILHNSTRENKGFGGVMEYGITDRWNKNFLLLAQILLERNINFHLLGGKKFGTDITFDWAKKQGFCHVLMCIGAGKPKLPEVNFQLNHKIVTASNFLMSAHLNQNWLKNKVSSPVLIIGSGLTAIDCSLLAIKEGYEVFLFSRGKLEYAKAFKGNSLEVEDALFKGVKIFENRILKKIINDKFCIFLNTETEKEEVFNYNLIIFAIGTNPNIEPILPNHETSYFTILGDLDKNYEGSVVKAFASVKNKKEQIFKQLLNEEKSVYIYKKDTITGKQITKNNFLKLTVKPFDKPQNANIFDIYKLQILNTNLHPIPLTLFDYREDELIFFIKNEGEGTNKLFKEECEILITKSSSNPYIFDQIVVEEEEFLQFKNTILFSNFHHTNKKTLFYIKDLNKVSKFSKHNYYIFLFKEMNCMLSGVCSRCLTQKNNGEFFYACKQNIIKLIDLL